MPTMDVKLSGRLSNLQLNASKESVQTLAKWMSFNRKFASVLSKALLDRILKAEPPRKLLYLSVAHEVLVADSESPMKWERMENFRKIIGEMLVGPAIENILESALSASSLEGHAAVEKITVMSQQWDTKQSCGNKTSNILETVKNLLERNYENSPSEKDETTSDAKNSSETSPADNNVAGGGLPEPSFSDEPSVAVDAVDIKNVPEKISEPADEQSKTDESPTKDNAKKEPYDFDFESEGVEFGKVQAQDFLEPCKSIATMQIAREIRNDTAARLMSVLQSIPKEVEEFAAAQLKKSDDDKDDDEKKKDRMKALEQLPALPDEVLDVDITEALAEVKQFRDVVLRQRQARKRCIDLLIKSRCRFGSTEAAQEFFEIGKRIAQVKKRKLLLSDAMELEGLDFEGEGEDEGEGEEEILEPLSWFKEDDVAS